MNDSNDEQVNVEEEQQVRLAVVFRVFADDRF